MKKINFIVLAAALLAAACNKSTDVTPAPSTADRAASIEAPALNGNEIAQTETSGTALHVYLDVYSTDPDKNYIDVNNDNYISVLNESFAYAQDLSNEKPFY